MTVIGGPTVLDPEDPNAVNNPTLLIEVLSRSTEEYDRGDKFDHQKHIDSLRQYVLVSHAERLVEVWSKADGGSWEVRAYRAGETAELGAIGARLGVSELYDAAE